MRVVNVRGGARMCVPDALDSATAYVLLEQEDWFEDEIRFVRRWLRPGMHAVDVGANAGIYTASMAGAVGPQGRVWAYEPGPRSADLLQAMLEANRFDRVVLRREAVSSRDGTAAFAVGPESELSGMAAPGDARAIDVPAVTLDRAAAEHGWDRVALVKIDVEGHELEVIEGARRFLGSASPLLMFEIRSKREHDLRALGPLAQMGYRFYRLIPQLLVLVPFEASEIPDSFQLNLFACKDDRREELAAGGYLGQGIAGPPEEPDLAAWERYVGATPYARSFAARWPARPASEAGRVYRSGLAEFAASRDPQLALPRRVTALWRAFRLVMWALKEEDTLPRRLSLGRIAWETGARSGAGVSLEKALARLAAESAQALDEPFLSPSPRHEGLDPGAAADDWLACSLVEQLERVREFSSFYAGEAGRALKLVDQVVQRRHCSPEMERRRQLIRMRFGLQVGPQASALLAARSDDNLNPDYWSARE